MPQYGNGLLGPNQYSGRVNQQQVIQMPQAAPSQAPQASTLPAPGYQQPNQQSGNYPQAVTLPAPPSTGSQVMPHQMWENPLFR